MGANWFTLNPQVKIVSGSNYTVKNVYGYIQVINHYSVNINNGNFSAIIRNFVGVGNTKDPVQPANPLAGYAICHAKKDAPCLDNNVTMVHGGNILITVTDGHLE